MPAGLIGRKLGMTRVFGDDGRVVPVTVIGATPNTVTRLRSVEQDGYAAVQLGAGTARRVTKPVAGQFKELAKEQQRPATVREFRVDAIDAVAHTKGAAVAAIAEVPHRRPQAPCAGRRRLRAAAGSSRRRT